MNISIGADELILWLRKNKKSIGVDNIVLGRKIVDLIKNLGGTLGQEDQPSLWTNDLSDEAMARLEIPKTAQQYNVDISILPEIFKVLNDW